MDRPGGASQITGRIVRAWTTRGGLVCGIIQTADGPRAAPISVNSTERLIGRSVHYLNGSWFLTTSGGAGR